MAGPLDILRSIAGRGTGPQGGAPRTSLPAYTDEDARVMKKVTKSIEDIQKAVKASEGAWEKMGDARSLHAVQKTLKKLKDTQKDFNEVMRDGNSDIEARLDVYNKLAKAQGKHTEQIKASRREMNEAHGMAGRLLNVLDDMERNKGPIKLAAVMSDLSIVLKDVNEGFDQLARGGQLTDASLGGLAASTARYSANMRIAMIRAALLGYSAEDSNKAFATLTETYGGTADVAASLEERWTGLAKLGRISGLGITGVTDMMRQGYERLGETAEETGDAIARMVQITSQQNKMFGAGKVNTREFAQAVQSLAYSQGFYNQNTRILVETLGREIQTQLALGKSRKAATEGAVKNLQLAAKVNIRGVESFANTVRANYEQAKAKGPAAEAEFFANIREQYGAAGEEVEHLIKSTGLRGAEAFFTFENLVRGSSEMQSNMMETLRMSAFQGPGALMGFGLDMGEALRMTNQMDLMATKLNAVAAGSKDSLKNLFGKDVDLKDEKVKAFAKTLGEMGPATTVAQKQAMYTEYLGAGGIAEPMPGEAAGDILEKLLADTEGTGWFLTMSSMANVVKTFFASFPFAKTALVLGSLSLLRPALFKLLKAGGAGALLSRGATAVAGAGGRMAMMAGRAGVVGLALYTVGAGIKSLFDAADFGDMFQEGQAGFGAYLGVWAGSMLNKFGAGFSKEEIKKLALGTHKGKLTAVGDAFYDFYEKWWLDADYVGGFTNALKRLGAGMAGIIKEAWLNTKAAFGFGDEDRIKRVREGLLTGGPGPTSPEAAVFDTQEGDATTRADAAAPGSTSLPPRAAIAGTPARGSRSARATASLSGGHLILEVSNWEDVLAESQHNMAALAG